MGEWFAQDRERDKQDVRDCVAQKVEFDKDHLKALKQNRDVLVNGEAEKQKTSSLRAKKGSKRYVRSTEEVEMGGLLDGDVKN